ncbi:MAG: phosphatidylserine decarboxylase family protein [Proteobacteria bacterium]|nr:phosphatidylserine decarboxylase family protein [Pseudomonadota bacterium]MBU1594409.1 phosphatidylserine decarboxylase family protein [Pseudomonadota bacterium]
MRKPTIGLSLEGLPAIGLSAFATLVFAAMGWWLLALILLAVSVLVVNFFRDPERVAPEDPDAVVSPADGRVIKVDFAPDPVSGQMRQVVCVFMNVFDVHVNRAPVEGSVELIRYVPGKYFNASLDKASQDNERNILVLARGAERFTVVQIAGLIARRIVCWAEAGDILRRGERFGLIKFGSRVDLYLPDGYAVKVYVGESVRAGETALAVRK